MDDLVIEKIGQYLTVKKEIYQIRVSHIYFDYTNAVECQTYKFQKYSNLYGLMCDYLRQLDTERHEDIIEIWINSIKETNEIPCKSFPFTKLPSEKDISFTNFQIKIKSESRGEGYAGGHEYTTTFDIIRKHLDLSDDKKNLVIKFKL